MLNKIDIIQTIDHHVKSLYNHVFYDEMKNKINNSSMYRLKHNEYVTEAIRLLLHYDLLNNKTSTYHVYLYHIKKKKCSNIKMSYNIDIYKKLIVQLNIGKNKNGILSYGKYDDDINEVDLLNYSNKFYIVISKNSTRFREKCYNVEINFNTIGMLFGVDVYNVYKYQRIDRISDFIKKGGESKEIYEKLQQFRDIIYDDYDIDMREKVLLVSGVMFQALGTTYTRDIDMFIIENNLDKKMALDKIKKISDKDKNDDYDWAFLLKNNVWLSPFSLNNERPNGDDYKSNWLTYGLPNMVGARDMYEVLINPKYYFMFMGIKFMSLDMNIKRYLTRMTSGSVCDLIMLNKINKINLDKKLCFPIMTMRQGEIVIFDNKKIEERIRSVKHKLKSYYNYDIHTNELYKMIPKCYNTNINIFEVFNNVKDVHIITKKSDIDNIPKNNKINVAYMDCDKIKKDMMDGRIINMSSKNYNTKIINGEPTSAIIKINKHHIGMNGDMLLLYVRNVYEKGKNVNLQPMGALIEEIYDVSIKGYVIDKTYYYDNGDEILKYLKVCVFRSL